jgi:hypothetical protein
MPGRRIMVAEAAEILNTTEQFVRKLMRDGVFTTYGAVKEGGKRGTILVDMEHVLEYRNLMMATHTKLEVKEMTHEDFQRILRDQDQVLLIAERSLELALIEVRRARTELTRLRKKG